MSTIITLSPIQLSKGFGWQQQVDPRIIQAIMRGIDFGDDIPLVSVAEIVDAMPVTYAIDDVGGGHHRWTAYLRKEVPMNAVLSSRMKQGELEGILSDLHLQAVRMSNVKDAFLEDYYRACRQSKNFYRWQD